jgi:hypothetical protein
VLNAEGITQILDHTHNLMHWTIIATFYDLYDRFAMQRASRTLKVGDIDSKRMVIHVFFAESSSLFSTRRTGTSVCTCLAASRPACQIPLLSAVCCVDCTT